MSKRPSGFALCGIVAVLAGCAAKPPPAAPVAPVVVEAPAAPPSGPMVLGDAARHCAALGEARIANVQIDASEFIGDDIAYPISGANHRIAGQALPAHCKVSGRIASAGDAQPSRFEWRAPSRWNARLFFQGRADDDRAVAEAVGRNSGAAGLYDNALGRGYAVWSQGGGAAQDASAALQAGTQAAKDLAEAYYGRPAQHSYFVGCGAGGRDGLLLARDAPAALDGIVAVAPALRAADAARARSWAQRQFLAVAPRERKRSRELSRAFSNDELFSVAQGILKRCDALDGAADGFVMDVAACRFDPAELQCRHGHRKDCLSAAKVEALRAAMAGPHDGGRPLYAAWPWDPGIAGPGWRAWMLDAVAPAAPAAADDALADDPLAAFGRHGKLLLVHGVADPVSSVWVTLDLQKRLDAARGADEAFARSFVVPGMNHCAGGPATDRFDALSALVEWAENGNAPERIEARGSAVLHDETRPLCPWPKVARYRGAGRLNESASYECR